MHADTFSTIPMVEVKLLKKGKDIGGWLIFPSGSMHRWVYIFHPGRNGQMRLHTIATEHGLRMMRRKAVSRSCSHLPAPVDVVPRQDQVKTFWAL
jgi:hypothetical protein